MKENMKYNRPQERQTYVPAKIKVIEVTTQRIMCMSTMDGTQNESYDDGDTSGWYSF